MKLDGEPPLPYDAPPMDIPGGPHNLMIVSPDVGAWFVPDSWRSA